MKREKLRMLLLLVVVLLFSIRGTTQGVEVSRSQVPDPAVYTELQGSADGTAYVIVMLKPVAVNAVRKERQDAVKNVQNRILEKLAPGEFNVVYKYKNFAAITGRVNAAGLAKLVAGPDVVAVGPDARVHGHLDDSVPFINADDVHALGYTGDGITVAVLDTGIDSDHPDLSDDIAPGWYHFLDQGMTTGPGAEDDHGHGTNVSGIITSKGVVASVGVAPDANILAIKVLKSDGTGWVSDWAAGVDYVVDHNDDYANLRVINMSLGTNTLYSSCPCDSADTYTQLMQASVQAAKDIGIVTFASSGNDGSCSSMSSPACLSSATAVAAVYDQDLGREPDSGTYSCGCFDSSTYGDLITCFSNRSGCNELAAPGRRITAPGMGGGTSTYTGTSQAAPHCSGVAALMCEKAVDLALSITPDQIVQIMKDTGVSTTDLCYTSPNPKRVDALAAVTAVGTTGTTVKWEQPPDETYNGIDIRCDRSDGVQRTLADDFNCVATGPITKVTFWGSWRNDIKGKIKKIHLSIHDDKPDPDGEGPAYSEPNTLLWSKDFNAADINETLYSYEEPEWFWDPTNSTPPPLSENHYGIWQYDITIDDSNTFVQQGDPCNPVIYWLDAYVELEPDTNNPMFGWKTSSKHWNDDAVYESALIWYELRYPSAHYYYGQSIDLAFVITTRAEEEQGGKPLEPHTKWSQPPIEIDPTATTPTYCGWDEVSCREWIQAGTYLPCWDCPTQCYGDTDCDTDVDTDDLLRVTAAMGSMYGDPDYDHCADIDRDFYVNSSDQSILFNWLGHIIPSDCPEEGDIPDPQSWQIVADDFRCLGTMPVTSIHWWGSYVGWDGNEPPEPEPIAWRIGFWSNIRDPDPSDPLTFSYPRHLLWQIEVPADRVDVNNVGQDYFPYESFEDTCFQYHVDLTEEEYFWQSNFEPNTMDKVFWLSIAAVYPEDYVPDVHKWGWKTRPWHWMDDAVTFQLDDDPEPGMPPLNIEFNYITPIEAEGESYDVAFELDTDPNYIKWEQFYAGYDVWADTSLLGWWKFDEGSGTVANDSSGNQRNGTIYGNPTWQTTGSPVGNSGYLKFDGLDDYVDVNYISRDAFLLPIYTVSAWFRVDGNSLDPGDPNRDFISVTNAGGEHGFLLEIRGNDDMRYLHRHPLSQYYGPDAENILTTATYKDGLWHHAAAVRVSDNSRLLYVDGQVVGSDSNATTVFDAPLKVTLGALFSPGYTQGGRWWNGAIDDVRIYNRALSSTEVTALYNRNETHYWPHYEDVNSMYNINEPEEERLVADDWLCLRRTPVTAISWWGSYIGYGYEACSQGPFMTLPVKPDYFQLNIWTDVAAGEDPCVSYSHPGEIIWKYKAYDYDEVFVGYDKHPQGEPNEPVFRYSVGLPDANWFRQPNYNEVFWLSVQAIYDVNEPRYDWGWTNHKHVFNDDAVTGYYDDSNEVWVWTELYDQTGESEDMSFILFTDPSVCIDCADYNLDGIVDLEDLGVFVSNWLWTGSCGYNNGDLDCNGDVEFHDFAILALQWLDSCP